MRSLILLTCLLLNTSVQGKEQPQTHWEDQVPAPDLLELNFDTPGVSEQCSQHWSDFLRKLQNPENLLTRPSSYWALKMFDAFGSQPIEGRYQGSFWALGSSASCYEVAVEESSSNPLDSHGGFEGKYCWLGQFVLKPIENATSSVSRQETVLPEFPFFGPGMATPASGLKLRQYYLGRILVRVGICIPNSCSDQDLQIALEEYGKYHSNRIYDLVYNNFGCSQADEKPDYEAKDIGMMTTFGIFIFLFIVGCLLDIYYRHKDKKTTAGWEKLLLGFSPYTNIIDFNAQPKNSQGHITCINGIRFASMSWVVLSHTTSMMEFLLPIDNANYFVSGFVNTFGMRAILNGFPCVDSFYVMSGTLVGYLTFKELDRSHGKLNLFVFYVHRYIRLTGVYAIIIFFHVSLMRYVPAGSKNSVFIAVDQCENYWWQNLLYINNIYMRIGEGSCMGQSWYMATNMQMFWVSPIMMVPMWWINKKMGKVWTAAWAALWVVVFTVVLLTLHIVEEWPATMITDTIGNETFMPDNYIMPWTRCQPYIVGIIAGYILHKYRGKEFTMSRLLNVFLWCIAIGAGIGVIYGLDPSSYWTEGEPSLAANTIFGSFHRLIWGVCVAWVIFACTKGYGGWINEFLSWEAFNPLSKLTYAIYLCHYTFFHFFFSQYSYRMQLTHFLFAMLFIAVMFYNICLALIVHIGLEVPLLHSDKVLFGWLMGLGGRKKQK